jgi:SAM-dependent methyltransferase
VAAARDRHPGVDVRQASAEALPFASGEFDAALAQLVVHFMRDPVGGLREMARVTRRGGVIAACVWDYGGRRDPLGPFWEAVRSLDASSADEAGLPGARQGHLAQLFVEAGIEGTEETTVSARRQFGSFEEWWEPFTLGVGPGGAFVARLDVERAARLRERCRSMLPRGAFEITAQAWAVRGQAP